MTAKPGQQERPDDPIRMLERCHERLLEEADTLCDALESPADRDDLEGAVSFFERQGVRHERDEEESLFPRLRGKLDASLLDQLTRQHREHERLCKRLRELLVQSDGKGTAELSEVAETLRRSYQEHIALEEEQLIPAAAGLLEPAELAAIHAEMQSRRGR